MAVTNAQMNGNSYQCCFCGLEIEPILPDVASLYYTTCIDRPELRQSQELYCHTSCLTERLHKAVNLYAVASLEFHLENPGEPQDVPREDI